MNDQYSFLTNTPFDTNIGPLEFLIINGVITNVNFKTHTRKKADEPFNPLTRKIVKQLKDYFNQKRTRFDLPMQFEGTDFQESIWKQIAVVPFGKTISYSDLAKKVKSPKAFRAAGSACGKNPLPILIPCHRILAQNKTLGGFGGGLEIKMKLLKLEGISYN